MSKRPSEPALAIEALEVSYAGVPAVRGIDLEVGQGEIVGLVGPNGAGKSSALHAVMGVVGIAAGDVRLHGRSVRGLAPEQMARRGVALVPEGRHVYASLTVAENLRLGYAGRRSREGLAEDRAWVEELFPVVREFARRNAGALSGGQQQQLAIARAPQRIVHGSKSWSRSSRSSRSAVPALSRAGSSSNSRLRVLSSRGRTFCCSTSPRSDLRRRSSSACSRRSARSASVASRSCSSSSAHN
jgi:ABC-type uncharacterized transport system ATPase subunit